MRTIKIINTSMIMISLIVLLLFCLILSNSLKLTSHSYVIENNNNYINKTTNKETQFSFDKYLGVWTSDDNNLKLKLKKDNDSIKLSLQILDKIYENINLSFFDNHYSFTMDDISANITFEDNIRLYLVTDFETKNYEFNNHSKEDLSDYVGLWHLNSDNSSYLNILNIDNNFIYFNLFINGIIFTPYELITLKNNEFVLNADNYVINGFLENNIIKLLITNNDSSIEFIFGVKDI